MCVRNFVASEIVVEEAVLLQWRSMNFSLYLFLSGSVILSLRLLLSHLKSAKATLLRYGYSTTVEYAYGSSHTVSLR